MLKKVYICYFDFDRCLILEFFLYVFKVNRFIKKLEILEIKYK